MKLVILDWGRTLYNPESGALFADTRRVLQELKGRACTLAIVALATAGQEKIEARKRIIVEEDIEHYFRCIKFDIENKDQMYVDTLRELGASTQETTIVDDRVARGIQWGNIHGCATVWVQNGKFAGELPNETTGQPTHTIRSIGELPTVV